MKLTCGAFEKYNKEGDPRRGWRLSDVSLMRHEPTEPSGLPVLAWQASNALLCLQVEPHSRRIEVRLDTGASKTWDPRRESIEAARAQEGGRLDPMLVPEVMIDVPETQTASALLGASQTQSDRRVMQARERLVNAIEEMRRKVFAVFSGKLASCLMPLGAVLLGAVMALRLQHAQVLVVYLLSFLPVVVALVVQNTGMQTAEDGEFFGYALMWLAPLALIAAAVVLGRRLGRPR